MHGMETEPLQYNKERCIEIQEQETLSFRDLLSWSCAMKDTKQLDPDITNKILDISYCLSALNVNTSLIQTLESHYGISYLQYYCLDNNQKKALLYISSCIQQAIQANETFVLEAEEFDNQSSEKIYEHVLSLPIRIRKKIAGKDGNSVFVKNIIPSTNSCLVVKGKKFNAINIGDAALRLGATISLFVLCFCPGPLELDHLKTVGKVLVVASGAGMGIIFGRLFSTAGGFSQPKPLLLEDEI